MRHTLWYTLRHRALLLLLLLLGWDKFNVYLYRLNKYEYVMNIWIWGYLLAVAIAVPHT